MADNQRIVNDIKKAEEAGAYMSALALSLTIPNICAGPNSNGKDYAQWVNTYYNPYDEMDITGTEMYALRCSFLHQNNANIYQQPVLKKEKEKPLKFLLRFPQKTHAVSFSVIIRDPQEDSDIINVDAELLIHKMLFAYASFLKNTPDFDLTYEGIIFEGE